MDAGLVLTPPRTPPPSAPEQSPDVSREDGEAFAAHLPQETQSAPAQRKPATEKEEPVEDEEKTATTAPTPLPSFSLISPTAPVLVREDGASAVLDIALTPTAPSPTPSPTTAPTPDAAAAIAAATPAAAKASPSKDITAPATAPATPVAAPQATAPDTATPAAPQPASTATNTGAPFPVPSAETLAAVAAAPPRTTPVEPTMESLRGAGRPRGAKAEAQAIAETKAVSPAAASAQSGARPDAKPAFNTASASAPVTPTAHADTAGQPTATGEAAAVSLETRRAAEAPPVTVHRPPTVAATVAQHVVRRFDGKSTTIDVRLDPAELGRVSVKLEVGADSRVTAVVAADNPATLSDLMRSARELERALESAGLELTQGGLSFDLSDRSSGERAQANEPGSAGIRAGNDNAVVSADAVTPASRPFGLESWRGVRVDVTV